MIKQFYDCEYCGIEYRPKRRRIQKYCSDTCRSKAHHARKTVKPIKVLEKNQLIKPKDKSSPTKDKMSIAGVGNAAAGTITADFIKNLLTKDDNKAATKGDMKLLTEKLLGRYHPIKNMPPHTDGSYPYYDLINQKLVYVANLKAFH